MLSKCAILKNEDFISDLPSQPDHRKVVVKIGVNLDSTTRSTGELGNRRGSMLLSLQFHLDFVQASVF